MILRDGVKIGDVMEFLPNGIIDKTATGIGATTSEATNNRHSIIVEPTRAIVESKSSKHTCLGFMGGVTPEVVLNYLKKCEGYRKIFVVSDSVHKLISILIKAEENVFKDYFYFVDEMEQYITEAGYRENMGIALDYYWKFPKEKRALVSAYVYKSSNPQMRAEPITVLRQENPINRKIDLKITNHPTLEAIKTIQGLKGNTLIFMNSVDTANRIIELGEFSREDCAVYCSKESKDKVGDLFKPFTSNPTHKYNFYTSAYFSGIDIWGKFNLVTIIDVHLQHTMLRPSQIKQIAGRARDGVLTDTIIINHEPYLRCLYKGFIELKIKEGKDALKVINQNKRYGKYYMEMRKAIIAKEFDGITIVRENNDGNVVLNYEQIDYKYISLKSGTLFYSNPDGLEKYLKVVGHTVNKTLSSYIFTLDEMEKLKKYDQKIEDERQKIVETVYMLIKEQESKIGTDAKDSLELRDAMYNSTGIAKDLLSLYRKTGKADLIKESKGDKKLIKGYDVAYFYTKLNSNNGFKKRLREKFKVNDKYSCDYITQHLNNIYTEEMPGLLGMKESKAVKELKHFFKIKRCKINHSSGKRVNGYQIIGDPI